MKKVHKYLFEIIVMLLFHSNEVKSFCSQRRVRINSVPLVNLTLSANQSIGERKVDKGILRYKHKYLEV